MNKKGRTDLLIIVILIAIAVFLFFYFKGGISPPGEGTLNGWWNAETQQCWKDENTPPGVYPPSGEIGAVLGQCCFDSEGYQVNCNNAGIRFGPHKDKGHAPWIGGGGFALYGTAPPGAPGYFSVAHFIELSNDGNVIIDDAYISSASWTEASGSPSSPTSTQLLMLNNYYQTGSMDEILGPIDVGGGATWNPVGTLDLQELGGTGGIGISYELAYRVDVSAGTFSDYKADAVTIYVEKEEIGFSVVINLGI